MNKMMNLFHRHHWQVVAFDPGYCTRLTDRDNEQIYHQVTFQKCRCGQRRMVIEKDGSGIGSADRHKTLNKAKHLWVETGRLQITDEADVYDPDYVMTSPAKHSVRYWDYKPVTEVDKIIRMLKASDEFKELCKHQMVEDAFGELETVIKMLENIDKTV